MENVSRSPHPAKEALLDGPDEKDDVSGPGAPEGDLLSGCRTGDVRAFEKLYELHGARMKSVARNLLGRESEAEDAVQEAFLKIYRGAASFRGSATISTWVYRILVNTCYDQLRKRRRHPEDPLDASGGEGEGTLPPASASDHPLRLAIEQSLSRLAPRQKTVFLLFAVEGFSHREIAGVLDVSEGASRALLFEAKRRLQDLLWTSGVRGRASA
ncbi:MAG: RNA polymerase sigma factor [Acidobacteriota bacterium]